jgi:hypothetical protein
MIASKLSPYPSRSLAHPLELTSFVLDGKVVSNDRRGKAALRADLVGRLADAVIRSGTASPLVRRNYAEALLRHGFSSAGLEMLEAARSDAVGDQTELRDANLRLGRAYAALYASALVKQAEHVKVWIRKAIDLCRETYQGDPSRCMSSEHFGQLAWQFKRVSGSSGLKVQAAIAC